MRGATMRRRLNRLALHIKSLYGGKVRVYYDHLGHRHTSPRGHRPTIRRAD